MALARGNWWLCDGSNKIKERKLGELRGGSVGLGELRVEVVLVATFWNSNCANELESRSEMVPDSRRSCLVWDSVLWVSHWLSGWLERAEERLGLEIP